MDRLQKILAHRGVASRRKCEELILAGQIKVNGKTITELGCKVDANAVIEVDGKRLNQEENKVYLLLNKPVGYITTISDPQDRRKVTDLLKGIRERVYPVGRLDFDSEGLLLLTNDGDLTYALTHPKHQVTKTYEVRVLGVPKEQALEDLRNGIKLDDGCTAPAKVELMKILGGSKSILEISIHEGRNRQVRRMFDYIGNPVLSLKRTKIAFLEINGLKSGEFRKLSDHEILKLKKLAIL